MIDGKKKYKTDYWVKFQRGLGKGAQKYTKRGSRQVWSESQSKAKKITNIWLHEKYRVIDSKVTTEEVKY